MRLLPTSVPPLLRGLWFRRGSSAAILALASLSCAAAALGPTYEHAARTSILRDAFASAAPFARGIEVSRQGPVSGTLDPLTAATSSALESGASAGAPALFGPAIQTIQGTAVLPAEAEVAPLVWRSGLCEQLVVVAGSCRLAKGTVIASESLAALNDWRVGSIVTANEWGAFTLVGIYRVPSAPGDYWTGTVGDFFPTEFPPKLAKFDVPPIDAMFTDRSTIEQGEGNPQGVVSVAQLVDRRVLSVGDMSRLAATSAVLSSSDALSASQASVNTQLTATVAGVRASWRTLRVAVLLVTGQTLLLVWLLLFLSVTDAVEARGRDCALAKLRGHPRWRLLVVALSESVTLLALAWPIGVGLAWAAGGTLSALLLRHGTGVGVPVTAWAVAAAGTIGGLVALSIAGRRVLRRAIVDQWRPTASARVQRSWVFDAVVLTVACAGLAELLGGAKVTSSAKPASLVLVVPGLLGVAIAVLASRGLVAACRAAFGVTSRHGRLAYFLAVRHVARRPGGMRTTMILTTAFALAGFGLVSWSIGHANRALVAEVINGAPVVMTVDPPAGGRDLGDIVDQIDPAGTEAMAVDEHVAPSGGFILIAVEPARLAAIAAWRPSFAGRSLPAIAADLKPNVAAPIVLAGGTLRVRGSVTAESEPLRLTVEVAGGDGRPQHLDLGTLDGAGPFTSGTAAMTGCPCTLRNFSISTAASHDARQAVPVTGDLTIGAVDLDSGSSVASDADAAVSAAAVSAALGRPADWRNSTADRVSTTQGHLVWSTHFKSGQLATLTVADRPDPLPGLVAAPTSPVTDRTVSVSGLDGRALVVERVADAVVIPGAPAGGVFVDRTFAERAAGGNLAAATRQVWTTASAAARVSAGLRAAGVHVVSVSRSSAQAREFNRQAPGLASALYLADAAAAALLAAATAVVGLVLSARRRRYEYAALAATGERRFSLFLGLFVEQTMVLVFSAVCGAVAGVIAARALASSIPAFVSTPVAIPLSYALHLRLATIALAATVIVLAIVAAVTSRQLVAGARADQLRETAT